MKKKIGISFTTTNFENYVKWFSEHDLGDDLETVILSFQENNVSAIPECDGFVLTGGIDINAQPERDLFESEIYRYAQSASLPVLGICRGMQLINVLEGGTLVQDLAEENLIHKKDADTDKSHEITINDQSLLHELTDADNGAVNSAHHQAIGEGMLGKNLKPNAWSLPDGCIEGIEFADKSGKAFMLGVQWHPERIPGGEENPMSIRIKERFLAEVRKQEPRSNT